MPRTLRLSSALLFAWLTTSTGVHAVEELLDIIPTFDGAIEEGLWQNNEVSGGNTGRTFTRTLAGQFTGHTEPDALTFLEGEIVLITAPGRFQAFHPTGLVATSFDVQTPSGSSGDVLVYSDSDGSWSATYDLQRDAWTSNAIDAQWADALAIRARGDDIVALSADGTTLYWDTPTGQGSRPLSTSCKSLEVLDFDGDGELEVLLLHSQGVRVEELTVATMLFDYTAVGLSHTRDQISVLPAGRDPAGMDALVYLSEPLGDGTQWASVAEFGIGFTDHIGLGYIDVVSLSAADIDEDGFEDLMFTATVDHGILAVFNQRSPASPTGIRFDNTLSEMLGYFPETSGNASSNGVQPAFADWDLDGDGELLYLDAGGDRYILFEDLASPLTDPAPVMTGSDATWNLITNSLEFDIDVTGLAAAGLVHVDVYRAPFEGGEIELVPYSSSAAWPVSGIASLSAPLPTNLQDGFTDIFYMVIQAEDGQGVRQHSLFGIWAFDEQAAARLQSAPGAPTTVWAENGNDDPTSGGSFVPGRRGGNST